MHWDWKNLVIGAGFLRMLMLCSFAIEGPEVWSFDDVRGHHVVRIGHPRYHRCSNNYAFLCLLLRFPRRRLSPYSRRFSGGHGEFYLSVCCFTQSLLLFAHDSLSVPSLCAQIYGRVKTWVFRWLPIHISWHCCKLNPLLPYVKSTISPLSVAERNVINETQKNWMLSDMDVQGKQFYCAARNCKFFQFWPLISRLFLLSLAQLSAMHRWPLLPIKRLSRAVRTLIFTCWTTLRRMHTFPRMDSGA